MGIRWLICFAGCILVLLGFAPTANACSCMSPGPACQAAWNADAVFIGQVLAFDPLPAPARGLLGEFPVPARRARIRVIERFRGDVPSTVDVITAGDGGMCGYNFVFGEAYLVYASRSADGPYATGTCSGTSPVTAAPAADVAYLRSLNAVTSAMGVIEGTARRTDPAYGTTPPAQTPHAGVRIVIEGNGLRREAITGADGTYEFAVPAGQYAIRAEVAEGLFTRAVRTVLHLKDTRACVQADIGVWSDGRITGRVVNARGEPLRHISVDLLYRSWTGAYARVDVPTATDAEGVFEFTRVGPGSFVIATDTFENARDRQRVFFPGVLTAGDAHVIHLAPSQRAHAGDFVLPESVRTARIAGVVRDGDGRAVAGARVYLRRESPTMPWSGAPAVTGADGAFAFTAVIGDGYRLTAELGEPINVRHGELAGFDLSDDRAGIEITLQSPRAR